MRILDEKNDSSLRRITLLLTDTEAEQLMLSLWDLLENSEGDHTHFDDAEYAHEITIAIYDEKSANSFNQRIQRLIADDQ